MFNSQSKPKPHRHEIDKHMSFTELTFLKPHGENRWTREEQEKRNAPLKMKGESSAPLSSASNEPKIYKENTANLTKSDNQFQHALSQVVPVPLRAIDPIARNMEFDDSLDFVTITFSISPHQDECQKAETPESTSSPSDSSDNDDELSESSSSDESLKSISFIKRSFLK